MQRVKLTIAYVGTSYLGWQVQPHPPTIQPLIQKALETTLRHRVALTGSGRTDAGVHAKGQTAHFDTPTEFDPKILRYSLNALLPSDIRILKVESVSNDFHARYSAVSKVYHYHLHLDPVIDPFVRHFRYHVQGRFDLDLLQKAAPFFIGTHDFSSFSNKNTRGSAAHDSIRTLFRLDCHEEKGGIRLEFEADGFLYKMVRNITGTLLDIAASRLEGEKIGEILQTKNRSLAGNAAPPQGLFLFEVKYLEKDAPGQGRTELVSPL